jgi:hypothetical protein
VNTAAGVDDIAEKALQNAMIAAGPDRVYFGPYDTTGQRDANGDGQYDTKQSVDANEKLTEQEYDSMCWFAKGIVQKADPTDPSSVDVDAHVPDGHYPPPSDVLGPPGAPAGVGVDCTKND